MTPTEYYDLLQRHDWFYMMSDSHSVWERGSAAEGYLQRLAKESPELQELYDGFHDYNWSGKTFGTEKAPKPQRPFEPPTFEI